MLTHKDSLNELRERFKLNIYEVKIWTALLSRGVAAASELADISGVPRSRCYDVLESLEKKGYIIMKIGKPIKYIAVQPDAVVDRVKKKLHEDSLEQISLVEKIGGTDLFKELELLHKTGVKKVDVDNITDHISGRSNINKFMKEMLQRAKKHVTIVTNVDGIRHKTKVLKKMRRPLEKNKIPVTIYANGFQKLAFELNNVQIKPTDVEARIINIDDREMLFIVPAKHQDFETAVWINSEHFVSAISDLFKLAQ